MLRYQRQLPRRPPRARHGSMPVPAQQLAVSIALALLVLAACAPAPSFGRDGTLALSPACSGPEQVVSMPDANLAAAVVRPGGTSPPGGPGATCAQLATLTRLTAVGVTRLDGLEHAVNLREITLSDADVSTLAPLAGLPRLEAVRVRGGSLTTLATLVDLPGLTMLEVTGNALTDISAVTAFPRLLNVTLNHNAVQDIAPLADLPDVAWIEIDHNQVTDLTPLAGKTKLRIFKANHNRIADASALADLPVLRWVELQGNQLTDMAFVENLRIEILRLANNRIASVAPLARNRWLSAVGTYDLRFNCIDLNRDDPFIADLLASGVDIDLDPQAECAP
jgi:hypothetical protein